MEKMKPDERLAGQFLMPYRLSPQRFTKEENESWGGTAGRRVKLPDFKVSASDGFFFYAEVKSLQAAPKNEPLSFNMFGKHISEAFKQFRVVNKNI